MTPCLPAIEAEIQERVDLDFFGMRTSVTGRRGGHLGWLREFLLPWFETVRPGPSDIQIALEIDQVLFESLRDRGTGAGRTTVFALDSKLIRLPVRRSRSGERIVFDPSYETFYCIREPKVKIVARPGDLRVRTALMRVVREFAMNHLHNQDLLMIHGACYRNVRGEGIIIAGPKRAGKTSLLVHALLSGGNDYVSNDRTVAEVGRLGIRVRGMPSIVSIRRKMLDFHPRLADSLQKSGCHHRLTLAEADEDGFLFPLEARNLGITPAQFCRILQVRPVRDCPASAVLFPRIVRKNQGLSLRPLPLERALTRLQQGLFRTGSDQKTTSFFTLRASMPETRPSSSLEMCRRLLEIVPAYDCEIGARAYEETMKEVVTTRRVRSEWEDPRGKRKEVDSSRDRSV